MRQITLLIILFAAQLANAQQKVLTEDAFLAAVKKYHPIAKQAIVNIEMAKADVLSSKGGFDPLLSVASGSKLFSGINYYNQQNVELKIPTWYGVDVVAGNENLQGSRLNPKETKGSVSYVGVSVPLLQNLLLDKRRAALRQARVYGELSEVERNIILNDLLRDALQTYWEWWQHYQVYLLIQSGLQNAEVRFKMVKTMYQFGDRPAIDTIEALTQVQSLQVKLSESFAFLAKSQLQLSAFLWTNNGSQYDLPNDIKPQELFDSGTMQLESLLKSSDAHPELLQYQFKLNALNVDRRLKFQSLLPNVNLKYNQMGYSPAKTISNAWFDNNYRFGISFSMPLRLSEGRGEYLKAKLKINYTNLEQVNKQVQIYTKVKQYYMEWEQTNLQLSIQSGLLKNITSLQKGEEIKFENGESSLFLVNSREIKTIETRQKLIELQAKNKKALTSLQWAAGRFGN